MSEKPKRKTRGAAPAVDFLKMERHAMRSAELRGERKTLRRVARDLHRIEQTRGPLSYKVAIQVYACALEMAADQIRTSR